MAEISVMAVELSGNSGNFIKLCDLCSRILSEVLSPEHGDQTDSATEVLKSLSRSILFHKSQAWAFGVGFVVNRMKGMAKDSGEIKKAIVNLPKYLVHKVREKAERRASAVEAIMVIVRAMEYEDQIGVVEYVVKMTQGQAQLRLLAVDLVPMLMMSCRDPLGVNLETGVENSWGLRCLEVLVQLCSDAVAGIRARALTNVAHLVGFLSGDDKSKEVLKGIMKCSGMGMNELLRKRCTDEKAAVREAALVLISKLIALLGGGFDEDVLKTIGMACSDPLVSIRKAAVSALSEAFRTFSNDSMTKEWLHCIPRLITDNESSIQEECESLFLELVLDRVTRAGHTNFPSSKSFFSDSTLKAKSFERELEFVFPEGVLGLLKEICNGEVTPWVKKICVSLGKKKRLKPKIASALLNIIRTSESLWLSQSMQIEKWTAPPGSWLLLSEVSAFLSKAVDWEFLHHHWKLINKHEPDGEVRSPFQQGFADEEVVGTDESDSVTWAGDRVFLLQTISNVSAELPPEPAADLAQELLARIEDFNMHSAEVNAHVKALRTLCKQKVNVLITEEADDLVKKWVRQVLSKASRVLDLFMSKDSEGYKDIGFLTPPTSGIKKVKKAVAETMSRLLSQAIIATYTIGSLVIICPSADLKAIIPVLHTIITSGSSDLKLNKLPRPVGSIKQTAPSLYIQAWLTMGKICLADGKLAKRYIPLFVQELEKSDCAALRNNIVVMMADFCIRYTALVDCCLSKITKCLQDPCELGRRQTFIPLSRLLQDLLRDLLREAFVPLTEEEKTKVSWAFSNSNRRKVLATHEDSNIEITGELLQCLRQGAWLNGEVINVYLELLKEREKREPEKFLKCHFFNTFFYKKLIGGKNGYDYKSIRRWTSQRKLGYCLLECDKIFVPIHKDIHWCLAVINIKDEKFQYLDSLKGIDTQVLKVLARYFVDEVKDKSGEDIDVRTWKQEYVEDLPEQKNGSDCGMFMIKYIDFYSRGLGLHFKQEHMPYFRQRTAKEILRLKAE